MSWLQCPGIPQLSLERPVDRGMVPNQSAARDAAKPHPQAERGRSGSFRTRCPWAAVRKKTKSRDGGWRHASVTLSPTNPDYDPVVFTEDDANDVKVVAEFVKVLR